MTMLADHYFYCLSCQGKKYEGRFNGKGMYTFNSGDIYTGRFLDN